MKLLKISLILFLFFVVYLIQAISSDSNILGESKDNYHNISNPIENNFVVCDQLSDNDDQRFIECQKILNLEIPDNDSLSCFGSQLKIHFDMFIARDCSELCANKTQDLYTSERTEGYLAQLTSKDEEACIIMHNEVKGKIENCKIFKRYYCNISFVLNFSYFQFFLLNKGFILIKYRNWFSFKNQFIL